MPTLTNTPANLTVAETTEMVASMEWTADQITLIRNIAGKDLNNDEFKVFLYVAKRRGLDPFANQIYAVKYGGKMTIQTGIDGFRVIADRTGQLAGISEGILVYRDNGDIDHATVTVCRIINGDKVSFSATAHLDEYIVMKSDGQPNHIWSKRPRGQLIKCAEALALRKAFPQDLSGIYTSDEMAQAGNPPNVNPRTSSSAVSPQSNGATATNGVEMEMQSKYGTAEKPSKCILCDKYHVLEGDTIVKVNGKWGAKGCYVKSKEPTNATPASNDEQTDDHGMDEAAAPPIAQRLANGKKIVTEYALADIAPLAKPNVIDCILYCETEMKMVGQGLLDARVTKLDTADLDKSTKRDLLVYLEWLIESMGR